MDNQETEMLATAKMGEARGIAKWCVCALILLAPGSFVIVPALWLARHVALRVAARRAGTPQPRHAGLLTPQSPRTA